MEVASTSWATLETQATQRGRVTAIVPPAPPDDRRTLPAPRGFMYACRPSRRVEPRSRSEVEDLGVLRGVLPNVILVEGDAKVLVGGGGISAQPRPINRQPDGFRCPEYSVRQWK
jgi:hypothetical protein